VRITTSGKIQHGGGRHLEFLFIQAISPDRYQVVQYVIRREITRGRDSDIAPHLVNSEREYALSSQTAENLNAL